MDMLETPNAAARFAADLAAIIERFVHYVAQATGSTSISVNRTVRHIKQPVYLHGECSNVMISTQALRAVLLAFRCRLEPAVSALRGPSLRGRSASLRGVLR